MKNFPPIRCVIIGDDRLSVLCAEALIAQRQQLVALISPAAYAKNWAAQNKIPWFDNLNYFLGNELSQQPFEYLFCIVHLKTLPRQVLQLPSELAINYHDALLPKFAGLHATSWALLNGEKEHGVSWHIMTEQIDGGDILLQEKIIIAKDETAFTLNLKCHQQALATFEKLLVLLARDRIVSQKQDLSLRTYYGRYHPLPNEGMIDWCSNGEDIDKLCRALDFSNQDNTLGTAKFIIDSDLYIIEKHVLQPSSGQNPGVISAISEQFIQIATYTQDIQLFTIKDNFGSLVPITELIQKHHLQKGMQLTQLHQSDLEKIHRYLPNIIKHESFWIKKFLNIQPLSIPFLNYEDKSRNIAQIQHKIIQPNVFAELSNLYQDYASLNQIILAAILSYLYRLNNCEEYSVAFTHPDLKEQCEQLPPGLVADWVPLNINFCSDNSFKLVLSSVKKEYAEIIQHISYQNDIFARYQNIKNVDLPVSITFFHGGKFQSPKNNIVNWMIDTTTGSITLCLPKFFPHALEKITNHFTNFLSSLVQKPDHEIKYHALLSDSEQRKMIVEWNKTDEFYLENITFHQLFEKQAAKTPNRIAVTFEGKELTYTELNQQANQLARYINKITVKNGLHIAIYLTRGMETIVSMLAVLKSGNIYVPIATEAPLAKIQEIITDCQAAIILTQQSLANKVHECLAAMNTKVIPIDTNWQIIADEDTHNMPSLDTHQHMAYVMYTSGSTGKPKGVQITQQSLVNFLLAINHEIDLIEKDVFLAITSTAFDISGLEIYLPLIIGSRIILMSDPNRVDPQKIVEHIIEHQVTIMQATPAMWQMLLNIGWRNETRIKMLSGGEGLNAQLGAQLYATGAPLWNLYGPTETTIWSTAYRVTQINSPNALIPIGKPIANTKVYVLDKNLQPMPIGIPGVLYIAGAGVAKGYLNKEQLTGANFIPNPFVDTNDSIMYNTGDRVKWSPDGNLEYINRIDNQIKIRGFRVELGEIESCLLSYPDILQAVVINDISASPNIKIVAYIVLSEKTSFSKEALVEFLKARLYQHMIPSYFVLLDTLPINSNGKIDKKNLPPPKISDLHDEQKRLPPTTSEQKLLAEIWAEVLSLPLQDIGINDDFFELGGHSLLATQVIVRIKALFSIDLNIHAVFESPTIKQLAALILESQKIESDLSLLSHVEENKPQPLSPNQLRIWFLNELYGNSAVYNIAVAWHLSGALNHHILNKAITDVIKRQGIFRTIIFSDNGKPKQILQPITSINFNLEIEALEDVSSEEIQNRLKRLAAEPFKLDGEELFRFRLLKLANDNHILFICLHHLIADGWSLSILYRELSNLYQSYYYDTAIALPSLPFQYVDFCAWQQAVYSDAHHKKQIHYWTKQLANLEPLELPIDYPRPAIQTYPGNAVFFKINEEHTSLLRKFSRVNNITLFTTMLSAFAILLAKYANQTDITIGIPFANRSIQAVENLIGLFINTLVIRLNISKELNLADLLKDTQNTILDAQKYGDVAFEKIVDELQPERDQSRNPIFQVMFAFNNAISDSLKFPDLTTNQQDIHTSYSHFELSCFLEEKDEFLEGYVEYNTDLFSHKTIENFINHYLIILSELVNKTKQSIHNISLLSASEKKMLLVNWNNTQRDYNKNKTITQLIEDQVNINKEKIAVIYQNEQITYATLNKLANKLAHFIRSKTESSGHYIAVYLDRSIESVICLLAIIKSQNIYVPIDKEMPLVLVEQIIEDCKAFAILTTNELAKKIHELANRTNALVITLDEQEKLIGQMQEDNLVLDNTNHLAYVMYTSGTTGKPKGVQITHASLINLLLAIQHEINFTKKDVLLAITPLTFDISGLELYLPLITGASFVFANNVERLDPHRISECIAKYNVTMMQATPVTWQMLINNGWRNEQRIVMLCGGSGLSSQLALQLLATKATLWNLYGPTETTIWSTSHKVTHVDKAKALVPIGKPLANTQVYVLDDHLQPMPIGVPGELYIGGDGVAEGYVNNITLNLQRFIPDLFAPGLEKKLYKTGDIVVWSAAGELHYIGRTDTQIKIRGHRIEAEEIENHIVKFEGIQECVVLDKSPTNEHELVAYIILKKTPITLAKLRSYLNSKLPGYMIPTKFIAIDKFPLTSSGKIDRKKLPKIPNPQYLSSEIDSSTPILNEYEKNIIDVIKRLINLSVVDPQTSFFDLGMHSLLLVEFSYALSSALKKQISVIELFTYPTVRMLTSYLMNNVDNAEVQGSTVDQRAKAKRARQIFRRQNYVNR